MDVRWIDVKNPATGELIDKVPGEYPEEDVSRAVDAAEAAFAAWAKKAMRDRGMILYHAAQKVRDQHKDLARLLTLEQETRYGNPSMKCGDMRTSWNSMRGISASQQGEAIRLGHQGDGIVSTSQSGSAPQSFPGICRYP